MDGEDSLWPHQRVSPIRLKAFSRRRDHEITRNIKPYVRMCKLLSRSCAKHRGNMAQTVGQFELSNACFLFCSSDGMPKILGNDALACCLLCPGVHRSAGEYGSGPMIHCETCKLYGKIASRARVFVIPQVPSTEKRDVLVCRSET